MYARFNNLEESCFIDGSEYKGTWTTFGMEGVGKFIMPHSQYILLFIKMLQKCYRIISNAYFFTPCLNCLKKGGEKSNIKIQNNYNKKQEISEL